MAIIPTGTVTFLFSDIEGSTKLARANPQIWEQLRQRHHAILRAAMQNYQGYVFQIIGDAFCVAFSTAGEALQAAAAAQMSLFGENWGEHPIKVRMGLHTGKADIQDNGEYSGYLTLSRVQRVMSAGYGGQVLLSQVTQELVRDELPEKMELYDLGEHRLKDLIRPEHIYQLNIAGLPTIYPPIKTLDLYRHNLPVQMTSFIGREVEIAEIKQALADHPLVTLSGPGGAGKTRLALQVAADLIDQFSDGVWLADLAPLSDPSLVPQAVAAALGVREEGAAPLIDLLVNYIQQRELLIVLDNCEHLLEACARLAAMLLRAGQRLKVIATSREGLGVAGEKTFSVPTLSFTAAPRPSAASLSQYDATRLFIDRALLVQPHFSVTNENAPAIAQICYRLDGIPLAIELAAARIKAISPEQIAKRLDDSFRLLTGGSRTSLPRQQTLRATMDWSWELTSEDERTLLRRLSVFSGGWTLEAAEAICAGAGIDQFDVLDLLTQLVSKSLVIWHEQQESPRYQLLETIRQYARGKLAEQGELEEKRTRQRHAEYYALLAGQSEAQIYSPAQNAWLRQLDMERDNLRAAFEWAINTEPPLALKMVHALGDYLFIRNGYAEGIQWCQRTLGTVPEGDPKLRAYALGWAGVYANQIGQNEQADQWGHASLDLARQSDDKNLLAFALCMLGGTSLEGGRLELANGYLEEALPLAREVQSPRILPLLLAYLGLIQIITAQYGKAEIYFHESVEAAQRLYATHWLPLGLFFSGSLSFLRNDIEKARAELSLGLQSAHEIQHTMFVAHIEEMLGRVEIIGADIAGARSRLTQSLEILRELSLQPCLAHGLEGWARLALAQGDACRAAKILGAIRAHLDALHMSMIPIEQAMYDQTLKTVQDQLEPATFSQEWEAGLKLSTEQAIEWVLH